MESAAPEFSFETYLELMQLSNRERAQIILSRLKLNLPVTDEIFDSLYSLRIRNYSRVHWTPLSVAKKAAKNFSEFISSGRILDIGAGCGKSTLVMAIHSAENQFVGIEQRPHLFAAAEDLSKDFDLKNLQYSLGNVFDEDWSRYQGFYFFNPFYEQKFEGVRMGSDIAYSDSIFEKYLEESAARLSKAPVGTVVQTYHGWGGELPFGYVLQKSEAAGTDFLKVWIKQN